MRGQSLFEVVIALALFAMIAVVLISVSLGGLVALTQGGDQVRAATLAEEGLEALRSIRDGAFNELRPSGVSQTALVVGTIAENAGQWIFNAGVPSQSIDKFTRLITLEPVCRDPSSRLILACPSGAPDPHTERATVEVSWEVRPGVTNAVKRSSYITTWDSRTWTQTDWSGGPGQASSWTDQSRFDVVTPSDTLHYASAGKVQLKKSAGTWTSVPEAIVGSPRQLYGVDIVSSSDVWAVGASEKVLHLQGSSWSSPTPTINPGAPDIRDVAMVSASDGWLAAGSGELVHCTGNPCVWNDTAAPSFDTGSEIWNDISMLDANNGWAVGSSGAIARYQSGTWTELHPGGSPLSTNLNAMHMLSSTEGWAAGNGGKIIKYSCTPGCAWALNTAWVGSPPSADWEDIFMLNNNRGWAVGAAGLIYEWNGSAWGQKHDTGGHTWYGVHALAEDDIWIVGSGGTVGHFNGSSWTLTVPAGTAALRDIDVIENPDGSLVGYVVGNANVVLRLERSTPYVLTGTLISSAFSLGDNSPVETLEWAESLPGACGVSCTVRLQLQTAPDVGGVPGTWFPATWMGPEGNDGDETDYFEKSTGMLVPSVVNGRRWVRYRATLSGNGQYTPVLEEVRIGYR